MDAKAAATQLKELNGVLNRWDPIGVVADQRRSGVPLTEYESLAPGILAVLMRGADEAGLASHLSRVLKDLGLDGGAASSGAQQILTWYRDRSRQ